MTRIRGYDLLACPSCGHVHRKTSYSSVSVYVPDDFQGTNDKVCASCQMSFAMNEFSKVGFINHLTDEEMAKRYAWTLYAIGQGPKPETKPSDPFLRRCWLAVKAVLTPATLRPWEKYPPLG
jgi:hypothetical protein